MKIYGHVSVHFHISSTCGFYNHLLWLYCMSIVSLQIETQINQLRKVATRVQLKHLLALGHTRYGSKLVWFADWTFNLEGNVFVDEKRVVRQLLTVTAAAVCGDGVGGCTIHQCLRSYSAPPPPPSPRPTTFAMVTYTGNAVYKFFSP